MLSTRRHLNKRHLRHWKEEPAELSTFFGIRTHTLGGLTCDMRRRPTFDRRYDLRDKGNKAPLKRTTSVQK